MYGSKEKAKEVEKEIKVLGQRQKKIKELYYKL